MRSLTASCVALAAVCTGVAPVHGQVAPAGVVATARASTAAGVAPPAPAGARDYEVPDEQRHQGLDVASGVDLVATSAFVWRGFVPVSDLSVEPNAWITIGHLTLSSWMNVASTRPLGDHLTEHDFTADYTVARGHLSFSVGYINYAFLDLSHDKISHELYAGISHASYFNPSVRVYQDVLVGSGTYVSLAASHAFELAATPVVLTPSLSLGYNHRQWIDASTFSDLCVGLKARLPTPLRRVSLAPFLTYSRSLARAYFPSRVYYGLGVSLQ